MIEDGIVKVGEVATVISKFIVPLRIDLFTDRQALGEDRSLGDIGTGDLILTDADVHSVFRKGLLQLRQCHADIVLHHIITAAGYLQHDLILQGYSRLFARFHRSDIACLHLFAEHLLHTNVVFVKARFRQLIDRLLL